ncbi:hypothetical protein BH11CYA1_BH11CYA1_20400 [soil metagenome]
MKLGYRKRRVFAAAVLPVALSLAFSLNLSLSFAAPSLAGSVYTNQCDVGQRLMIPVHSWANPDLPVKGVIVALQGLIFSGKMFGNLATHFTEKGYIVYANDMRGFGDWRSENHGFAGDGAVHFGQSKEDLTSILKALRKKYPDKPIFCVGESFGANMAIWEASTEPSLMDGFIASGAVFRTRVHPRPLWVKTFFQGIHNPDNSIDIKPYMQPILSEDKNVALELMNNTETSKEMSITNLIKAAVTNKNSVKEIANIPQSMPILLIAGEKDRIQKTDTLELMVAEMGSKHTSLMIFPDKGHMLLECKNIDAEVGKAIDNWLDREQEQFEQKNLLSKPSTTASSSIESSLPDALPADVMPADAFSKSDDSVSSN